MGLDMYLSKELYVGGQYGHRKIEDKNCEIKIGDKTYNLSLKEIDSIKIELLYWRKANAIHDWFVKNVQDGEDDCKSYYVDISDLEALRDKCKETLDILDKAKVTEHTEICQLTGGTYTYKTYDVGCTEMPLTPREGFFFGSTSLDTYFYEEIERTLKVLNEELAIKDDNYIYKYESSW